MSGARAEYVSKVLRAFRYAFQMTPSRFQDRGRAYHELVDVRLLRRVQAEELRRDGVVDVRHGLQAALAEEALLVLVAELQGLASVNSDPFAKCKNVKPPRS